MAAASFNHWESDPLFPAAEVVQDSADRMESIFRLLGHEKSLVQGECSDPRLLTSVECHWRDLATTIETTKWQLEDFERAVGQSFVAEKSRSSEDVTFRRKQFIIAIREQIIQVEKSLKDPSILGYSLMSTTECVNFNDQDSDGLASFLSGGDVMRDRDFNDTSSIMGRFFDPTPASSFSNDEIVEHEAGEMKNTKMNGVFHADYDFGSVKENLTNVSSHFSAKSGIEAMDSLHGTSCHRHGEDENWDVEADEAKGRSFLYESKLRGALIRMDILSFLGNLWSVSGSRVTRGFTKKWKDEAEQKHAPIVSRTVQGRHAQMRLASVYRSFQGLCSRLFMKVQCSCRPIVTCRTNFQRSIYGIRVNRHSMQLIMTVLAIIIFGILASQLA